MKLKDWLDFKCISVAKFCKYNDISAESIYGNLKGNVPRSNVAVKIFRATSGEVSYEDLGLSQEAISRIKFKEKKRARKVRRQKLGVLLQKLKEEASQLVLSDASS